VEAATSAGKAGHLRLGTKANNATSCGNAFVTNIVLASRPRNASAATEINGISSPNLTPNYGGKYMMELADVRNALENTATKLADFRGSL